MKKRDTKQIVNQAIRFVKSNPCCICSNESFCDVKYKSTCKVWRVLKSKLLDVSED
jgi:hypothetical protein